MATSPLSPRLIKGGLVLLDPATSAVKSIIVLQYNPDSLSRNLTPQSPAGEGSDRSAALRYKGPPIETIRMEAEVDAADQPEHPDQAGSREALSVLPILSAIEDHPLPGFQPADRRRPPGPGGLAQHHPTAGAAHPLRVEP